MDPITSVTGYRYVHNNSKINITFSLITSG